MARSVRHLTVVVLLLATCLIFPASCAKKPSFDTEYQAVFMDNGQVFFGKLAQEGNKDPILKEVYYIGRQQSPDGKEVRNVLLKRGNEWHGPDFMSINRQHIVIIEPVSPSSRVAQLIKEARTQTPQQQQPSQP